MISTTVKAPNTKKTTSETSSFQWSERWERQEHIQIQIIGWMEPWFHTSKVGTPVAAQYTRILLHIHESSATLLGLSQKSVRSIRQENWLQSWQSGTMKSQDSVLSANSNKSKNVWSNLRVPHLPWKLPTFAVCQSIQSNRKKHTGGCTSSTKNVQNSCYKNSCKIPKSPPLQQ